jgi:hypothetical protein
VLCKAIFLTNLDASDDIAWKRVFIGSQWAGSSAIAAVVTLFNAHRAILLELFQQIWIDASTHYSSTF